MTSKRRSATRNASQDYPSRSSRSARGDASGYRAEADSGRRNVTLAIIGLGVLVAFLVIITSVERGNVANAPVQQPAGAQNVDGNAAALQEQLRQNPGDARIMVNLGNTYYDAKRFGEAIQWYQQALEKIPNDTNVRTDLGTAYFYSGNIEKAKEEWNRVLQQDPNKVETQYNLGILYSSLTPPDNDAAAKQWEAVLRVAPNSTQAKSAEEKLKAMGRR